MFATVNTRLYDAPREHTRGLMVTMGDIKLTERPRAYLEDQIFLRMAYVRQGKGDVGTRFRMRREARELARIRDGGE